MRHSEKTILVIDDDNDIRRLTTAYLTHAGYAVIEAQNGDIGLEYSQQHHPDLILSDLKMPGMDGLDVLEELRALLPQNPIPFILLTGDDDIDVKRRGSRLGVTDFVVKPIRFDELISAIGTYL